LSGVGLIAVAVMPAAASVRPATAAAPAAHHPSVHQAPAALRAAALIHAAHLRSALGKKVSPTQDNGGYADTTQSFSSSAEVATTLTTLTVSIFSYRNVAAAKEGYKAFLGAGAHRIKGVGDQASQNAADVTVRTGSQVMTDDAGLTAAGQQYVASHNKSPQSMKAALYTPARKSGEALGRKLRGKWNHHHAYRELPKGAVNPCPAAKDLKGHITAQPATSDSPPMQKCDIDRGGRHYTFLTYTDAQSRTAISTDKPSAVYAQDLSYSSGYKIKKDAFGPFKLFMRLDSDWQVDVLVDTSKATTSSARANATARSAQKFGHGLLMRIDNDITGPVQHDCKVVLAPGLKDVLHAAQALMPADEDAEYDDDIDQDETSWCKDLNK
jgi:hypothetical protein